VRLIGVGISGLEAPTRQLSLWDFTNQASNSKEQQLQTALEVLRQRFGEQIVQRANEISIEKPNERPNQDRAERYTQSEK
jgi:hypothetical protein